MPLGRRWYLVAYDLDRHDWRSFRLDRLTGPRVTAARFRARQLPAADAAAFVRAGIRDLPTSVRVEAVAQESASVVRARVGPWCTVEAVDPGRCRVQMTADSLTWAALCLGAMGADFSVTSPPELRDLLGDWSRRFGRAAAAG